MQISPATGVEFWIRQFRAISDHLLHATLRAMTSSLLAKKSFLPPGYRIEYRAAIESRNTYLPKLVDASFRELIEPLVLKCAPIVNLKGRDQMNLINREIAVSLMPNADEFCFASGIITKLPKSDKGQEFSIAVNSKFVANEETPHMLHLAQVERHAFPESVPVETVGRIPAVRLKLFRLGFDIFESRFLSSLIGTVPTVWQTLLVEADERKCEVSVVAEGLKSKHEFPLQKSEIWQRLQTVLSVALGFNLESDYRQQLQK